MTAEKPAPPAEETPAEEDWRKTTQPEKPFETEADKAAAEATPPDELEFSTPPPTAEEVADADKVAEGAPTTPPPKPTAEAR